MDRAQRELMRRLQAALQRERREMRARMERQQQALHAALEAHQKGQTTEAQYRQRVDEIRREGRRIEKRRRRRLKWWQRRVGDHWTPEELQRLFGREREKEVQ
jgi:hypothetical protein